MNGYATALIIQTMPDIHARFTPRWKPEPKTIRRMARRLVGRWMNASPQQNNLAHHDGSLQHGVPVKHDAATQSDDSAQHRAPISHANQQQVSVQLSSPVLQVTKMPIRSKMSLASKASSPAAASLKHEEPN